MKGAKGKVCGRGTGLQASYPAVGAVRQFKGAKGTVYGAAVWGTRGIGMHANCVPQQICTILDLDQFSDSGPTTGSLKKRGEPPTPLTISVLADYGPLAKPLPG